jgi:hypothetical protein
MHSFCLSLTLLLEVGFLSFFLETNSSPLSPLHHFFNAGGDRSVSHQERYWLSFPSLTLLQIDRLSSTTRCTSSDRNRSVHDHSPISSTTLPLHYKLNQRWNLPSCSLSRGKKTKHKHNPKTPTFNNPKTQTTTDHNNAETQNTSPLKGKNKKRQLNPPLSSLSNKQQEEQQTTTGFNKTNQRRLSTQFSTKFSATFSECAMREHSSPSRMLHDSARLTTESKTRSFAAIPKRKETTKTLSCQAQQQQQHNRTHSRYSVLPGTYLRLPGTWFYAGHRYLPTYLPT